MKRAEALLDDMHERAQALRIRGGQIAGFSGAVITLVGTNAESILGALDGAARASTGAALLTGTLLLIGAFALRGTHLPKLVSDVSVKEIANYTTERFEREPDLWRVQMRTIAGLVASIRLTARQADRVAIAVSLAGRLFLLGLLAVGYAIAILISNRAF